MPTDQLVPTTQLIVEADFEHSSMDVTIRFYEICDSERILLRMQEIYNICHRVRQGRNNGWNEEDQQFFKFLWPEVSKPHIIKSNLKVLKIPNNRFDNWLRRWEKSSLRLIDRATQKRIRLSYEQARIRFHLTNLGRMSELAAMVELPDGSTVPYTGVRPVEGNNQELVEIKDEIFALTSPIDRNLLDQLFRSGTVEVPTDKLAEHLPNLLNHRLDLLTGPAVEFRDELVKPRIRLAVDGGDILISLHLGPGTVPLKERTIREASEFKHRNGRFVIRVYRSDRLDEILQLVTSLPTIQDSDGRDRISGTPRTMRMLFATIQELEAVADIDTDDALKLLFDSRRKIEPSISIAGNRGWLDIDVSYRCGDKVLSANDVHRAISDNIEFIRLHDGTWLRLDPEAMAQTHRQISELGPEFGSQRVATTEASPLIEKFEGIPDLRVHRSVEDIVGRIKSLQYEPAPTYPDGLRDQLRRYQQHGVDFLVNRARYGLGCILGDEMGLGKTIQLLAYFSVIAEHTATPINSLIVCPASVVHVWLREQSRFAPLIRMRHLTGSPVERRSLLSASNDWDIIVATYTIIRNDLRGLKKMAFHTIALDEAQQIKNPDAAVTQALKSLSATNRIVLTGTPLENRMLDLWSIVDFLNPGYLGSRDEFRTYYDMRSSGREKIRKRISPILMRRRKDDVEQELPPKTEDVIIIPLTETQRRLYDRELMAAKQNLNAKGFLEILTSITRLRQICCHPGMVTKPSAEPSSSSEQNAWERASDACKLQCLCDRVVELTEDGHSALVFSQFTRMLAILEDQFRLLDIRTHIITGSTLVKQRWHIVEQFQGSDKPAVFLLSLKAAGVGLTLTKADYVFIFDPWWNPAVESQAIDRTHRIGQDKPVFAYRLIAADTIEEKVLSMQEEKRRLFAEIVDGADAMPPRLMKEDLIALLT